MGTVEKIPWALEIAGRILPGSSCLVQATVAQIMYSKCGIYTDLHFGVSKRKGSLKAHAWLASNGDIVVGKIAGLEQYKLLYTVPGWGGNQ